MTRRDAIRASIGIPLTVAARGLLPRLGTGKTGRAAGPPRVHIAVIGAGAFGGWSALSLLRAGARVTLIDAWGAGNSRASSGGETRVIRGVYGDSGVYVKMAVRAFSLWRENEARMRRKLYYRTGALWMFQGDDAYARSSVPLVRAEGLAVRELSVAEARRSWPQIELDGIRTIFLEKEAGFLLARQACELVREEFVKAGGEYVTAWATPGAVGGGEMKEVLLTDGTTLRADRFVFACGPWLGEVLRDDIGNLVQPTRQEVFFFGTPAGDSRFSDRSLPVWVDFGERLFYGIPGNERRGFKIADDTHGEPIDPTSAERLPSGEALARARKVMATRFPILANAPLVETRVCQYENSPDSHFIIDRHPRAENAWIAGGGSGHGFKMGPAVGEYVARLVLETKPPDPSFTLARFAKQEPPNRNQGSASRTVREPARI